MRNRKMTALQRFSAASALYLDSVRATCPSPRTVSAYEMHIQLFRDFWTGDGVPSCDPTADDARRWRDSLLAAGKTANTARQYMATLSRLFTFNSDEGAGAEQFYFSNPFSARIMPRDRHTEKRPYDEILTDAQVAALMANHCPNAHLRARWPRDYAVIVLLLTTGLRNAELRALCPCDLDFENAEICVEHGKGNKFRAVDFPPIARSAIHLYYAAKIRDTSLPDTAPLFGSYRPSEAAESGNERGWKALSESGLSSLVMDHVAAVTGVQGVRTHALRHVCARIDLNGGMRLEELQTKLGHSEIRTTQIYSGKLMARRQRKSAEGLLTLQAETATANEALLAKVQAKGYRYHAIVSQ